MKGKDELEGTRSNFTTWLRDFEHQGKNCVGGLLQPPLGELGLILLGSVMFGATFNLVIRIGLP